MTSDLYCAYNSTQSAHTTAGIIHCC